MRNFSIIFVNMHSKQINTKVNLIVLLGPTASGKTGLAAGLAYELDTGIISADSRQVYKGMDIGTGKDLEEFEYKGSTIPYYLIDIAEAGEKYNLFEYQKDFADVFSQFRDAGKIPILCGGTGMYIDAVLKGYKLVQVPTDEALREKLQTKSLDELAEILASYKSLHNASDTDTKKRAIRAIEIAKYTAENPQIETDFPEVRPIIFGIDISREDRRRRITERLHTRLKEGLIEEAKELHARGLSIEDMIYYGLEYKFLGMYLSGELTYDEMVSSLNTAIHQFSKRQMTFFRKMEKDGHHIHWIDFNLSREQKMHYMLEKIQNSGL